MRKIVHYVKEYDPKVKLLCGCRDGFIQHNREEVTCKRCIKSLKARGQPFRKQREFRDPSQRDLFGHRERLRGMGRRIGDIVSKVIGWLKSNFRPKEVDWHSNQIGVIKNVSVGYDKDGSMTHLSFDGEMNGQYKRLIERTKKISEAVGDVKGCYEDPSKIKFGETLKIIPEGFEKEIEIMGKAGKASGERNQKFVMDILTSEEKSEDGSLARP